MVNCTKKIFKRKQTNNQTDKDFTETNQLRNTDIFQEATWLTWAKHKMLSFGSPPGSSSYNYQRTWGLN